MRTIFLWLFIAMIAVACAGDRIRASFDQSLEQYNQQVRWQDIDNAGLFVSPSISAEFRERAEVARKARIIDYEVIGLKYDEKRLEGSSVVVFSYYLPSSGTVRKVTDNQKWIYTVEGGTKGWRLTTPLPLFR